MWNSQSLDHIDKLHREATYKDFIYQTKVLSQGRHRTVQSPPFLFDFEKTTGLSLKCRVTKGKMAKIE